jgi:hypothetical protein
VALFSMDICPLQMGKGAKIMIKWRHYEEGKGLFAKHLADSQLKCGCGNVRFNVRMTEDGDIYVQCPVCKEEETIQYN